MQCFTIALKQSNINIRGPMIKCPSNLLELVYNNLICHNISDSSHLKSLKVKPKYLTYLINLEAIESINTVKIYR